MKLLVEISEEEYTKVKDGRASVSSMRDTIRNATPITECEDCISREEVKKEIKIAYSNAWDISDMAGDLSDEIDALPRVYPKSDKTSIEEAINHVEDYICNQEKDTVKAQGMAQALDMIEEYAIKY